MMTSVPVGTAWNRLQQASLASPSSSALPVEQLSLSSEALAVSQASKERLGQLSSLSEGLTGSRC